ncbi:PHD-finger domain-containing protein [Colletotrichum melonis]|uniref:PHD-finger domain-containing protein n=1 Tax=Colletotrichum melonis TaxID=1209925 RepID=A0AAI9UTD9_9PEZI|nr:PHD-finger domain-containing protein [Colletotrichum melonis]
MSGDQLASRQEFYQTRPVHPPTPKQTPTSAVFPSPVFETPKQSQGHFDDAGGWTPRFAEEYSVFNTTPGNLRGSPGSFPDFATGATTFPASASLKRPLSAESLAAQIATHANHFSPNTNLPLPPVTAARRLPSSPRPPIEQADFSSQEGGSASPEQASQDNIVKSSQGRESVADLNGQTATPPPSSHKGGRKLAPKLQDDNMQNDHGYGQPDFSGNPQHPNMAAFVTATDMFGYPMSAPANASASFWDPSADMSGMEIDFSFGPNVFQTSGHRHMPSFDASQMFQEPATLPPSGSQETAQPIKRTRPLAPKPVMNNVQSSSADISMVTNSFSTSMEDPFGIMSPGGVDPGVLFGRPLSANMGANIPVTQGSAQFALAAAAESQSRAPMHGDIRRSLSTKELGQGRPSGHASINSPVKMNGRLNGLQRSASENRGRRGLAKPSLPKLAPAIQPRPQVANGPVAGPSRPPSRPSGRISPLKQQHSRLSSLTSIPESAPPRPRTAVKFTIDSRGRARAETTMVMNEPRLEEVRRLPVTREMPRREKSWESEDDDSSTDDEPIIIPSRNTSFALPDPRRPSSASMFHSSRRSVSEHSSSSLGASVSQHEAESEAETVMNEAQGKGGDAASELRKLVESRQKRGHQAPGSQRSQRFASGSFQDHLGGMMSPTGFTEASLPSPTKATYNVRCVCRNSTNRQGEYMVQCNANIPQVSPAKCGSMGRVSTYPSGHFHLCIYVPSVQTHPTCEAVDSGVMARRWDRPGRAR